MSWPYIALVSLSIFWLGLVVLLTKWPRVANKSISQHSASQKSSYLFFTAIQASVGLVTYLFMIKWFIPHFSLPILFTVLYTIVAWLQIISAFIPDTGEGLMSTVHLRLANCFALGMLLSAAFLCFSGTYNYQSRFLFIATLTYMLYSLTRIAGKKGKPELLHNYLLLQVIYIVSFQVAILYAAFYG